MIFNIFSKKIFSSINLHLCFILVFGTSLTNSCTLKSEATQTANISTGNNVLQNSPTSNSQEKEHSQTRSVLFKGISLQTPILSVSEIKASEMAASPLEDEKDKPDYVKPRHILLKFGGEYQKKFEESNYSPEIRIYPVAEFRQAFSASNELMKEFDKEATLLQKLIAAPEDSQRISEFPFLLFTNAGHR